LSSAWHWSGESPSRALRCHAYAARWIAPVLTLHATPPARRRLIRRAREVLSDAGWLFDDFVNNAMRKVLVSQPEERDQREEAYRRARVATELKAGLESLIETYEADARLKERREQQKRRN
jgi:hypothetical protein